MAFRTDLDEDDVRIRPNRRGSRPRSNRRPAHRDAESGIVTLVDRGRYRCVTSSDTDVTAVKARALGRRSLVVGDKVALTGNTSGAPDTLARIVRVEARQTLLRRSADDADSRERPLVANCSQMAVVIAATSPEPRTGFVDRCLIAAVDAGISPIIVVTKTDLADPHAFLAPYRALNVPIVYASPTSDLTDLRALLSDHQTVLIGHSGVGKSTLVNRLVPGIDRKTGHVNDVTGKGRHTSSSTEWIWLPGGGSIIDTPGVRGFGLEHVTESDIVAAFPDLIEAIDSCPRGCRHRSTDCSLADWAGEHPEVASRIDTLLRILGNREWDESSR